MFPDRGTDQGTVPTLTPSSRCKQDCVCNGGLKDSFDKTVLVDYQGKDVLIAIGEGTAWMWNQRLIEPGILELKGLLKVTLTLCIYESLILLQSKNTGLHFSYLPESSVLRPSRLAAIPLPFLPGLARRLPSFQTPPPGMLRSVPITLSWVAFRNGHN